LHLPRNSFKKSYQNSNNNLVIFSEAKSDQPDFTVISTPFLKDLTYYSRSHNLDCHEVYRRSESSNKSAVTTLKQIIQDSKRIVSDLEHGPDLHQGMLLDIHKEFEPQVSKIKEKHENIKDIIENHLNFKNDDSPLKNNLILEIFPEEIRQQNDFNFFVKKTFPELKRRENLQPFEIAQLPFEKRNIRYLTTLKQWLRKVEFFTHFPDLIIQRV